MFLLSVTAIFIAIKNFIGKLLHKQSENFEDIYENKFDDEFDESSFIHSLNKGFMSHLRSNVEINRPCTSKSVDESELGGIKPNNPFQDRFKYVYNVLVDRQYEHFHKIVEFGCSDYSFYERMQMLYYITDIVFVDNDEKVLKQNIFRILPKEDDHLYHGPLYKNIKVCKGCVSQYDSVTDNADAVVCIELIQTLTSDILDGMVKNIFGAIKPELVIITTPNKEFNPLLNLTSNSLRHKTHVFEWTRPEFSSWAYEIVDQYPEFSVYFDGIYYENEAHLDYMGPLTQVAVFYRCKNIEKYKLPNSRNTYKLISRIEYPHMSDAEVKEKVLDVLGKIEPAPKDYSWVKCEEHELSLNHVFDEIITKVGYHRLVQVLKDDGWVIDEERMVVTRCPYYNSNTKTYLHCTMGW